MFENQYIDYAADMTILLAYYKCKDDWKDEANQIVIQAQKKLKEEGKQMDKAVKKQAAEECKCGAPEMSVQAPRR